MHAQRDTRALRRNASFGAFFFVLSLCLRVALSVRGGTFGEARSLESGGHRVATLYFHHADPPERELLVVSHGGLASKETMLPLCWEAFAQGMDCIAVDALGHGASTAPTRSNGLPSDGWKQMVAGLRVDRSLGEHRMPHAIRVHYIGHSMGGALGVGRAFPCGNAVSIGNGTPCGTHHIVYGSVHRSLGLPEQFYTLSHVLEPWTPSVVSAAYQLATGKAANKERIAIRIALAWASFFSIVVSAIFFLRLIRNSALPGWARGPLGVLAFVCMIAFAGARTLWYLVLSQWSDLPIVAGGIAFTFFAVRIFRPASPFVASVLAACTVEGLAWFVSHQMPVREMSQIGQLIPILSLFTLPCVMVLERLSRRTNGIAIESAMFVSALGSILVALLFPGS